MKIASALLMSLWFAAAATANDWLTLPSTYSHDAATGVRVRQFAPETLPTAPVETSFRSSGYTHFRSSLNYGASADNYHRVEAWGDPVRPYGEWRFPFRPYSTPYPNWGPPYGGLNLGFFGPGFRGGYPSGRPRPGDGNDAGRPTPGEDHSGNGHPGHPPRDRDWPSERRRPPIFAQPGQPYPSGGQSPYPVAPYYDGFYPSYGR